MLWKDTGLVWKMQAIPIWTLEKRVGVWGCCDRGPRVWAQEPGSQGLEAQ